MRDDLVAIRNDVLGPRFASVSDALMIMTSEKRDGGGAHGGLIGQNGVGLKAAAAKLGAGAFAISARATRRPVDLPDRGERVPAGRLILTVDARVGTRDRVAATPRRREPETASRRRRPRAIPRPRRGSFARAAAVRRTSRLARRSACWRKNSKSKGKALSCPS